MEDWMRTPEERGSLGPPRRLPPTAVGIATPPPPHRRGDDLRASKRLNPRAVAGFLLTFGGGIAVGSVLPVAAGLTVAAGFTALLLSWQVRRIRGRRRWARHSIPFTRTA